MLEDATLKVKKLNNLIQQRAISEVNQGFLYDIVSEFARLTDSNTTIIGKYGKIIVYCHNPSLTSLIRKNDKDDLIDMSLCDQLSLITETKIDAQLHFGTRASEHNDYKFLVSPIIAGNERISTIFAYKKSSFEESDSILSEFLSAAAALFIMFTHNIRNGKAEQEKAAANSAINSLSYSELEAIIHIFNALDSHKSHGKEGLIVTSKVADHSGITRSVIVNSLRRLESARVIETRSLGVKGTYIKVLNEFLSDEIRNLTR